MATPNYEIDYNDPRFAENEKAERADILDSRKEYNKAIGTLEYSADQQLDVIESEKNTLTKNQKEQHEFAIDKIEQEKEQAHKDYIKEQSAAYKDYQRQIDPYGVNAEIMAANGLAGTGWAESSKVAFYNSYQNRISAAREAQALIQQGFDNQMTEARLQNNAILAQIALDALAKSTEVNVALATQKSQLLLDQAKTRREIKNTYYQRYLSIIDQINEENNLKEKVRQHEAEMAYKNAALAEEKRQFDILHPAGGNSGGTVEGGGGSGGGSGSGGSDSGKGNSSGGEVKKGSPNLEKNATNKPGATIDMASVLNLGYGPISAKQLDTMVASGRVERYVDGDKIKFRWAYKNRKPGGMVFGKPTMNQRD